MEQKVSIVGFSFFFLFLFLLGVLSIQHQLFFFIYFSELVAERK